MAQSDDVVWSERDEFELQAMLQFYRDGKLTQAQLINVRDHYPETFRRLEEAIQGIRSGENDGSTFH